jgi:5-formyltetrahydrofolate cyclo-ligase
VAATKQPLRRALSACRIALSEAHVATASAAVQQRLIASPCYRECSDVVLYAPKDHEVGTESIFAEALRARRRVFFPKIQSADLQLSLVRVTDSRQLIPGVFGILEATGAETVPLAELRRALICVPGLAFSPCGQRLGRGGGYYDRLLLNAGPETISVGLAFSFQLLDLLPESPSDRRVNLIVTESALFDPAASCQVGLRTAPSDQGGVPRC